MSDAAKIRVEGVYKLFGPNQEEAMRLLEAGKSKDEILDTTGCTVGVQDATVDIAEGRIFVVMGLSGSGKSTFVRLLNGLITPTVGKILIDGEDVVGTTPAELRTLRRNKVSMVFQHFALFPHKTIAENTAFGLKIKGTKGAERRQRAKAALKQVSLEAYADAYPEELSGGMQQRVGLARCLASNSEILLMDEPFSALDPLIRSDMQEDLLDLQREMKKTIVFITHDLNEALILGDQIAIMKDGRFAQVGTAQDIVDSPADDYVAAFTKDIDRSRVFTAENVISPAEAANLADAPQVVLDRMETLGRNALYVLDGERIAGVVTYRDLSSNGVTDLSSALVTEYPAAPLRTQLNDLYALASSGLPIAVTNKNQRLVGVVEPEALFAQLSGEKAEADVADTGKVPPTAPPDRGAAPAEV